MLSAFGVDHGISKSYTKMAPKLAGALKSFDPAKSTDLSMKLRSHAGVHRLAAGQVGRQQGTMSRGFPRAMAQEDAQHAKLLNAGASRANKPQRFLP
jgi:hypothetical protein